MLTGFIVTKFVAVSVGPNGVALLDNYRVSCWSEWFNCKSKSDKSGPIYWANVNSGYETTKIGGLRATSLLIMTVSVSSIGIILMSEYYHYGCFNNKALYWLLIVVGLSLPFNAMNSIF